MQVSLVYEPERSPPAPTRAGPEGYARFAGELTALVGAVPVFEGKLRDVAPATGFILFAGGVHPALALQECPKEQAFSFATRLVPLDVSRKGVFDLLETWTLPAAIDALAFLEWTEQEPGSLGARGLYGQKGVGNLIGASCVEIFSSSRYCFLESETHRGLTHLLADYLRAWNSAPGIKI